MYYLIERGTAVTGSTKKSLVIFIDETDMWHDLRLYEAIVGVLESEGLAGATVNTGLMGYGRHRRIHRRGLFGVSDDKPVTIVAVDDEQKVRAVLPHIVAMVREGLIMLQDTEVISTGTDAPS
jgi:PII-like signaling protein